MILPGQVIGIQVPVAISTSYSSIEGNISYGDIDAHPAVAGALVLAINTETNDKIHAYSDANGDYLIPVPVEEEYWVYIEPLDGSVLVDENTNPNGYPLRPGNISSYVYSNTIYTDYPVEFYNYTDDDINNDEGASYDPVTCEGDNPQKGTSIAVAAER